MYRDIATMDDGPGYLNGILSLILNTTSPAARFSEEEQRAIPYFHRSRAADLLAMLDAKFPNSTRRPELHAKLLEFYASSGESEAVIRGGREFLAAFPNAPQRTDIALLMADAYARTGKTARGICHLRFSSSRNSLPDRKRCRWVRVFRVGMTPLKMGQETLKTYKMARSETTLPAAAIISLVEPAAMHSRSIGHVP